MARRLPSWLRGRLGWSVAFLLVVFGWGWYLFEAFLTDPRPIVVSTPSSFFRAAEETVALPPRSEACLDPIPFSPRGGSAQIRVLTRGKPAVPLRLSFDAPGYRTHTVVRGYRDKAYTSIPVTPPRTSTIGTACIRNLGTRQVELSGTTEGRVRSSAHTRVDGQPVGPDVGLVFYENGASSILDNVGDIFDRIAVWQPFGRTWLAILALLTILLVPLGTLYAFASSLGRD